MAFNTGDSKSSRTTISEINVTPLVDVMLVLLIIFMVTTPMMQQGIEVKLPETSSTGVQVTDEPLVLVIQANQRMTIGKQPIEMNVLRTKLGAIFQNKKNKQIYIQADRKVDYGFVAEAMAEIRSAGILNISLVTNPKTK